MKKILGLLLTSNFFFLKTKKWSGFDSVSFRVLALDGFKLCLGSSVWCLLLPGKLLSPAGCVVVTLTILSPWWLPERTHLYSNTAGFKGVVVSHALDLCALWPVLAAVCAYEISQSHPGTSPSCPQRPLSGGQVADEISSESKFSRPPLVELKPSKDILPVSGSSRAYLAL